jgi:hypothetical protein
MNRHRIASTAILLLAATALGACAVDTDQSKEESLGQTSQALASWGWFTWGTTMDVVGVNTGYASGSSSCILTGVGGNLAAGSTNGTAGIPSTAVVKPVGAAYKLLAHGGRSSGGVWQNNPVGAQTVCIPVASSLTGTWTSQTGSIKPPKRIGSLSPANRLCFLSGVEGGSGLWSSTNSSARVVRITTPDAAHPDTGWYVEGTHVSTAASGNVSIYARCIDFPTLVDLGTNAWAPSETSSITLTSAVGVKACGLTAIGGRFNVNDYGNGVFINPPSTPSGIWGLTVSGGKSAVAQCFE